MPTLADAQILYRERAERIRRAIALEPVDRLPVIFMGTAFAPRYVGMSIARFCADPEARVEATLAAMERLGDLDGINAAPAGRITPALTRMWLSRVAVPGRPTWPVISVRAIRHLALSVPCTCWLMPMPHRMIEAFEVA